MKFTEDPVSSIILIGRGGDPAIKPRTMGRCTVSITKTLLKQCVCSFPSLFLEQSSFSPQVDRSSARHCWAFGWVFGFLKKGP